MKKSTKGALAAAAAGTLLLGGAGSLAFWNSTATVGGVSVSAGHLKLVTGSVDCATAGWTLDEGIVGKEAPYVAQLLVPGDTLTKTCTVTVDAAGDHLGATFTASAPATTPTTNALRNELDIDATYQVGDGPVGDGSTAVAIADNDVVTVNLSIAWPYDQNAGVADNDANLSSGIGATLDAITITAVQTDTH